LKAGYKSANFQNQDPIYCCLGMKTRMKLNQKATDRCRIWKGMYTGWAFFFKRITCWSFLALINYWQIWLAWVNASNLERKTKSSRKWNYFYLIVIVANLMFAVAFYILSSQSMGMIDWFTGSLGELSIVVDWFILASTLAFIVLFGVYKTRGSSSARNISGNGDARWWTVGLSVAATQASAITFKYAWSGLYGSGWNSFNSTSGLLSSRSLLFAPSSYLS
jgi:hypothetical protein